MKCTLGFVVVVCALIVVTAKIISPDDFDRLQSQMNLQAPKVNSSISRRGDEFFNPGSPYSQALEAIFGIGIRLQLLLEKTELKHKNFLVSPLSMAIAVGQLMLGARGKLRQYLADLLVIDGAFLLPDDQNSTGLEEDIPLLHIHRQLGILLQELQLHGGNESSYILETTSALFLQPDVELTPVFKKSIHDIYNTSVMAVEFNNDPVGAQKTVNDWAYKNTRGRIPTILAQPLPRTSSAVLANAIYFKGDWETPFSDEFSANDFFHLSPTEKTNTTYLRGILEVSYANSKDLNCSMIVLPYKNKKMSMYIILPNVNNGSEYEIGAFTANLHSKDIFDLIKLTKTSSVVTVIPKMKLSNTISILDPLKKYKNYKKEIAKLPQLGNRLNVKLETKFDVLDDKINVYKEIQQEHNKSEPLVVDVAEEKDPIFLRGASQDPRFRLTDIVQQMSLAVNEKGTEAAAITSSTTQYGGNNRIFKANRPFMFFIRHEITEAMLFWGTIVNPT